MMIRVGGFGPAWSADGDLAHAARTDGGEDFRDAEGGAGFERH